MDINPYSIPETPWNLCTLGTLDQLAFDTSLGAYSNLVRPGWIGFTANGTPESYQVSSPLNDIPESRDARAQRASDIWPALAARPLMSKLKSVGLDRKVVDRKDLMGSPDELAIMFDVELRNYYDLVRPASREDFYTDEYGHEYNYFDSTSPLFCLPLQRRWKSDWRGNAWGALAVWCLKGKLMKVGFHGEGDGRG